MSQRIEENYRGEREERYQDTHVKFGDLDKEFLYCLLS
jgi:hypothetical protein